MLVRNDCRTDYRVLKEAGSLARAGYAVTVIAINPYGPEEHETYDGFTIVRVPVEHHPRKIVRGVNLIPRALWRMAETARKVHADVYHAHDSDTVVAAWWAARQVSGARLVYDAHEVGFTSLRASLSFFGPWIGLANWLWVRFNDFIIPRSFDAVIAVNDVLADLQAAHYGIVRPVVVMNCPLRQPIAPATSEALASRIGVSSDTPIVLTHGMFSISRGDGAGLENLVRSAALLHRGVVVLVGNVGSGYEFEPLRSMANSPELTGRVFFLPLMPPTELMRLTTCATLGIITLQLPPPFHLAAPNKFFEFLGAGLPVVTSDLPVVQRICEEYQCGIVCDPGSSIGIAAAINVLLDNPTLYNSLQQGARCAAAVYNWENQEQVLIDLYRSLGSEGRADVQ